MSNIDLYECFSWKKKMDVLISMKRFYCYQVIFDPWLLNKRCFENKNLANLFLLLGSTQIDPKYLDKNQGPKYVPEKSAI